MSLIGRLSIQCARQGSRAIRTPIEAAPRPRIRIVDADPALLELLGQWLDEHGFSVVEEGDAELVIVDVPFPRQGRVGALKHIAAELPGTPILALSANFFAGIEASGAVARWLGVAGALPKPVTREVLAATVRRVLEHAA